MIILRQAAMPETTQAFDLSDRGLLLADGVFDTSLVSKSGVFLRDAHLNRLMRDAAALDINCDRRALEELVDEIVDGVTAGVLRLTVTRGPGGRGLAAGAAVAPPTLMARIDRLDVDRQFCPISLGSTEITRNPDSLTAQHKTLAYTDNIMAARGAAQAGHGDALMLNTQGRVACAASANVFARFGSRIVTPSTSEGALGGIMRAWLLDALPKAGFDTVEGAISVADLATADQVFITNSLRLISPLFRINEKHYDTEPLQVIVDRLSVAMAG